VTLHGGPPASKLAHMASEADGAGGPVVLYDGTCALCSAAVRFVIARDSTGRFRFAALQSEAGARLVRERGHVLPAGRPGSVLLVEGRAVLAESEAALRIARSLDGAWPALAVLGLVPRALRDPIYRFVARRRHRWFGRASGCDLPDPGHASRFLS
jgi:predicted DCC family thiol-disulfide oxidoreductase YuxK